MSEEKIRAEARRILDKFGKSLSKVKLKEKDLKVKEGGFRGEESGNECDEEFRSKMFANAPEREDNHIVAEKKKWS